MTTFYDIPSLCCSAFSLWALFLCCASIVGIVFSFGLRRYRYALLLFVPLALSYFLWQVIFDIYSFGLSAQAAQISRVPGNIEWLYWALTLTALTLLTVIPICLILRYSGTHVTPLSIKYSADKMNCGICYWLDNGHVIFSNDTMNRLCRSLTGHSLMNGNHFRDALSGEILTACDGVWSFSCRDLKFEGDVLHEMVAYDVTEIYKKTESLKRDNAELQRLKEELSAYSFKTDDTVRRQEILQAQVNIHDEMNRLMLSTMAADGTNAEELNRIFAQWEKNTLLLCLKADDNKDENDIQQLDRLAQALNIRLVWNDRLPDAFTKRQKELFITAAKEAIANAVKHGHADKLEISFAQTPTHIICNFANGGNMPKSVRFSGGLSNLVQLASEYNIDVFATIEDAFVLSMRFPKQN